MDFVATNVTVNFADGEMVKTAWLAILQDSEVETDETVILTLHDPVGSVLDTPNTATLTIVDDDSGGQVISDLSDAALRSAVSVGGPISFATGGTILLTNTIPVLADTTLDAAGHAVTFSGGDAVRLFDVASGVTFTLKGLTLANGHVTGMAGAQSQDGGMGTGGAIQVNNGILNLLDCRLLANAAYGGSGGVGSTDPRGTQYLPNGSGGAARAGAVYLDGGTLNATNSEFAGNLATGGAGGTNTYALAAPDGTGGIASGGAIYINGGSLNAEACSFSLNQAKGGLAPYDRVSSLVGVPGDAQGGAICNNGGTVVIANCKFGFNGVSFLPPTSGSPGLVPSATASGGALCNAAGDFVITASVLITNSATGGDGISSGRPGTAQGGAVFNVAVMGATNCTFTANTASGGLSSLPIGGEGAIGGAVCNSGGTMALASCTLSDNATIGGEGLPDETVLGGGVFSTNGVASLINTILANNSDGNGFGLLTDLGHNLSSDGSCNFTGPGSLNSTDPVLGPLGDYGGPTPTIPLLAGSPAIDGGDNANYPLTDQRGHARPYGSAPDIGAFESSPPYIIRGSITGILLPEVSVGAGSTSVTTEGDAYTLSGLAAGSYTVAPTNEDYLFVPATREVTVGPDQLGVDFKAYLWNSIALEGVSNGVLHFRYTGTNGYARSVWTSSNLIDWTAISTNLIGPSNQLDFYSTNTGQRTEFYRAVGP